MVKVQISRCGKELTLRRLESEYQDWILQMHSKYDDDCNLGVDEPDVIVDASNIEELGISSGGTVYCLLFFLLVSFRSIFSIFILYFSCLPYYSPTWNKEISHLMFHALMVYCSTTSLNYKLILTQEFICCSNISGFS